MPLICEPELILHSGVATTHASRLYSGPSIKTHNPYSLPPSPASSPSTTPVAATTPTIGIMQRHGHKHTGSEDSMLSVANLRDTLDRTLIDRNAIKTSSTTSLRDRVSSTNTSHNMPAPMRVPQRQGSMTRALNDTPLTTAPSSPNILPMRQNSGTHTPRVRPTTLDIPGLTKSKVSPDGRIASRDVGSKLVIVMVGLPARGKSYITKKLARYLNWLQHDTRIFNVGEKRRIIAAAPNSIERSRSRPRTQESTPTPMPADLAPELPPLGPPALRPTRITLNSDQVLSAPGTPQAAVDSRPSSAMAHGATDGSEARRSRLDHAETPKIDLDDNEQMDQSAQFFDPCNTKAFLLREQCAMDTLDELLDYILDGNGSVGILDATNSTLERRQVVMQKIRERAGPDLNVLFLESRCVNKELLESNMMLKLSGPDYRTQDPTTALEDFKKRVALYEKSYVPLGEYEEASDMPYIQMIDVGRKIISHQIKGFLMAQANYYLLNFNLAPRQIWITRHGLSVDNISGKIGGDSDLSPEGDSFAHALSKFMRYERHKWDARQRQKQKNCHFPPQPGDETPPNPHYSPMGDDTTNPQRAFCVWTSMLKRSIQTGKYFDEEEYDVKQMRMLDELHAGTMEGLTYADIQQHHPAEYNLRKKDKLHYRYPGPGGEGYLDIINRLRPVIVELERMTDHVLLVGHRSVSRVLLAYFRGLDREEVADLDVPIGMLYCLEPKPYGVEFVAYQWDKNTEWFYEEPNYQLHKAPSDSQY